MIPELQRLSMKGRARTAEDEARFTELLGRMNVDAQRMVEDSAQSNQLGIESNVTGLLNDLSGETQERMLGPVTGVLQLSTSKEICNLS